MDDKSEYYKEELLKSIIFSYTIKKGRAKDKITFDNIDLQYQNYQHHKLPITMNPLNYGKLINQKDNEYIIQVDEFNEVKFYKEGDLVYDYRDHKISADSFIRSLDNKKYTFKNNELVLLTIDKSVKFIKSLLPLLKLTNKIITLDIETYIKNGEMIPFIIS